MGDRLTPEDKQHVFEALLKIRALHEAELRNMYLAELEQQLGQTLSVHRHADARHDLWSLIVACAERPKALLAFLTIVRRLHGDTHPVLDAVRLLEEIQRSAPSASAADRERLVELLAGVSAGSIAISVQSLIEPTALAVQPNWADAAAVVRLVADVAPGPDAPIPLLVFADRLAHEIDGGRSIDLHRWIDRVGEAVGMSQNELRRLCIDTRRRLDEGRLPVEAGPRSSIVSKAHETGKNELSPDSLVLAGASDMTVSALTNSPTHPVLSGSTPVQVWGGVPIRNPDFTGRGPLLVALDRALQTTSKASVLPQTLHGLGGVGKTQLALEYVYQNASRYDLVWWIPSEHSSLALESLENLARSLGLPINEDRQQTAAVVRDTLASSNIRWLLVFDNADQPDEIAPWVPSVGGHVILTSRNHDWASRWDAIEVDVFNRDESVALVTKRSKRISSTDAHRLAEKLGDLPLALDQAASWQAATEMPVSEYLQLFDQHVNELLSEGRPAGYHTTVAAFVNVAHERLTAEAPAVGQLLELFAYLAAEPISVALLRGGRNAAVTEPLRGVLQSTIALNRTIRDLRRYGLAKVDPNQQIQVHRLVQLVLREGMESLKNPTPAQQSHSNVVNLLAAANPGDPDNPRNWQMHAEMGPHILAARLIETDNVEGRRVALDQIRYLWVMGDYEGARRIGNFAVDKWRQATGEGVGPDGELTLVATRHLAGALRSLGEYEAARRMTSDTLDRFRAQFGEDHEHTLATSSAVGSDLRLVGEFNRAMEQELRNLEQHVEVFGEDDVQTLRARNNVAVAMRMLGNFQGALELDQVNVDKWRETVGDADPRTIFCLANVARDLYGLGHYRDALTLQEGFADTYRERLGANHLAVLLAARTMAITLRKVGRHDAALSRARENYRNYHSRFGADHEHTLAATMSYANGLRVVGELNEARGLAVTAVELYENKFGKRHVLTLAAQTNRAIILRAQGHIREALELDRAVYDAMRDVLGDEHGYVLCVANNLANDLALSQEFAAAHVLSDKTLATSRKVRGNDHPYTLACAVNAAFDLKSVGQEAEGQHLLDRTTRALADVLGAEHPETVDAIRGRRAECDIEPPPT